MTELIDSRHIISKVLSENDVGLNGSHQSGICIPKKEEILTFFPKLNELEKNPRVKLVFVDPYGTDWSFFFIYYNNRFFGGTRNEYRLTRMSTFIKQNNLTNGDEIIFSKNKMGDRQISYHHQIESPMTKEGVVRLGSEWKVLKLKER